jgi:hypothetical protein
VRRGGLPPVCIGRLLYTAQYLPWTSTQRQASTAKTLSDRLHFSLPNPGQLTEARAPSPRRQRGQPTSTHLVHIWCCLAVSVVLQQASRPAQRNTGVFLSPPSRVRAEHEAQYELARTTAFLQHTADVDLPKRNPISHSHLVASISILSSPASVPSTSSLAPHATSRTTGHDNHFDTPLPSQQRLQQHHAVAVPAPLHTTHIMGLTLRSAPFAVLLALPSAAPV